MIIAPWESAAITNKRTSTRYLEQSDSVRYFRHIPPVPTVEKLSDWEVGLREAIHQALLREGYWEPNLRERLTGAQLIGRQDHATPFGDVAVLARGQLYAIHAGNFILLQDPYQNDCDDCYNPRRCERHDCQPYSPHNQEILVALWTVKRIRHRDVDRTRFDLEYIVSPLNANNDQIIMRRGKFNYAIPGHVFAVRSGKNEKNYPEVYNRKIPQNNFKPQVPLGVDSEGHRNILYSYPGFFTSLPAQYLPPDVSDDTQEAQLYKKLLEVLASKTSSTQQQNTSHVSSTTSMEETTKVTGSSQEQIPTTPSMPTSPMTISSTASTIPKTMTTMKTTITYYMPTGEEILMPQTEPATTQKLSPTTKPPSRPTKKYTTKSKTTKIPSSTKKSTKTTFSTTKRPTTIPKASQLPSSTKKPIKTTISTTKTPTTTSTIPSTSKMYVKPTSRTPTSPTTTKIIKTSTKTVPVTTSRPMTQKTSTKTTFTKPSTKTTIPITTITTTTRVTTTSPTLPTVISTQYEAPTKTTVTAEGISTEYKTSIASTEVISTQYQAPTRTTIPSTETPTTMVTTSSPTTLISTTSPLVEETSTEPATVTEENATTKITTTNFETTSTVLPSTEYETKLSTAVTGEITQKTTLPEETITITLESTSPETMTQIPFSTMTTTASTTTKPTTKPTSRRTTTPSDFLTEAEPYNGPIYVGSVKNDYSLDDIFGPTTQTEKPTSTSTTSHTESDISQQLFGGELPQNSKIIFSGFYEASTAADEENDRKKKASQFLTSQSYETEVSYEVNKRSNTEAVGVLTTSTLRTPTKPMFRKSLKNRKFDYTRKKPSRTLKTTSTTTVVETTTMESTYIQKVTSATASFADPPVEESVATTTPAVEETSSKDKELEVFTKGAPANILIPPPETPTKAIVKQMPTNRTDFVIYKAEYPDEVTEMSIPENTKAVFEDLALRLVSHAKGLEYLNRTNRTAKAAKYRRRKTYMSRSKRPVRKKKEPEEEQKT
ncbi:unnamed protein product [Diabrotica balteata]|uniref:Uncharacterized protein n=1 Tax=Diabrotica balteata TaxID=107213 RepID=A0A9N9STJ0_DIABA|nr:unnamed protein product [Diabrotica balteata]